MNTFPGKTANMKGTMNLKCRNVHGPQMSPLTSKHAPTIIIDTKLKTNQISQTNAQQNDLLGCMNVLLGNWRG
jgi:hypothetical protein